MNKEQLSKQQFFYGQLPQAWIGLAFQYKMAADDVKAALLAESSKLWVRADAHKPVFLLYGYAFEIFAKGYRLALDPSMMSDEKLHQNLHKHNPQFDLEKCQLGFDDFEKRILRILTNAVEKGRYPVPKKHEQTMWMKPDSEFTMKGDVYPDHVLALPGDYDAVEKLWLKVVASYEARFPNSYEINDKSITMTEFFSQRKIELPNP